MVFQDILLSYAAVKSLISKPESLRTGSWDPPEKIYGDSCEQRWIVRDWEQARVAEALSVNVRIEMGSKMKFHSKMESIVKMVIKMAAVAKGTTVVTTTEVKAATVMVMTMAICHWIGGRGYVQPATTMLQSTKAEMDADVKMNADLHANPQLDLELNGVVAAEAVFNASAIITAASTGRTASPTDMSIAGSAGYSGTLSQVAMR